MGSRRASVARARLGARKPDGARSRRMGAHQARAHQCGGIAAAVAFGRNRRPHTRRAEPGLAGRFRIETGARRSCALRSRARRFVSMVPAKGRRYRTPAGWKAGTKMSKFLLRFSLVAFT